MIWFDYILIITVLLSILISVMRGFIREALSVAAWVLAIVFALRFGPSTAPAVEKWVTEDMVVVVSFVLTFFTLLLCFMVINVIIIRVLRVTGFGGADRSLGALFGLIRGGLAVIVMVLVVGWFSADSPWWKRSTLVPYVQVASRQLEQWFPRYKTIVDNVKKRTAQLTR